MTREEHLKFCAKCNHRKFNPDHGLVCDLTDQIADFEGDCEDFDRDQSVVENVDVEDRLTSQIVAELPDAVVEKFRIHQDFSYALIGGFSVSVVCAILWAVISVISEYQIVYMAIGLGYIVGRGVRFFGAGVDPVFGYVGSFFAFFGCALGNLFTQVGFIAQAEYLGFIETLMLLDMDTIRAIYQETFNPMDILFYAMAIYAGYKFAFRPIPHDVLRVQNVQPENVQLRLPLIFVCLLIIGASWYGLSNGVIGGQESYYENGPARENLNGKQEYHYENGQIRSQGEYKEGLEHGSWFYFHENGKLQLMAEFHNGLETDEWQWYYDDGTLMQIGHYNNGLFDQLWTNYYPSGAIADSTVFEKGRKNGPSRGFYENGQLSQIGVYKRDRQVGLWTMYHENGQKSAEGNCKDGEPVGKWNLWDEQGNKTQVIEHLPQNEMKIWQAWDKNQKQVVRNGNGTYKFFDTDGNLTRKGQVKSGIRTGTWIDYFADGKVKEEAHYEGGEYIIENAWSDTGEQIVTNGEGNYVSYFPDSKKEFERGQIRDGHREGSWQIYHSNSIVMFQDVNYKKGKLDGKCTIYYVNGVIESEGNMKDGKRTGNWTWYYESGAKQCEINYENDEKQGTQTFWSEMGIAAKEEEYKDGQLVSEKLL